MKTFLEIWLAEALLVFAREFPGELQLIAADQLPALANALSLDLTISGAFTGRFSVLVDREELHGLLAAANVAEEATDALWEADLWRGLLDQVAQAVAAALDGVQVAPAEPAAWTLGLPAAAYQLRLASAVLHIAVADHTHTTTAPPLAEPERAEEPRRASPSNPRIDLLLDVELEASLRFGSREMSLNEVLDLGPGDVVELDRHIAEPVDLLVGDRIVARGEVVLVNGNFGFSVLEVAEAEMRLESIRCLF